MTGNDRRTVHAIVAGFCAQCRETEEWLVEHGHAVALACGDVFVSGYANALDCVKPRGHAGDHVSFGGSSWRPGANMRP